MLELEKKIQNMAGRFGIKLVVLIGSYQTEAFKQGESDVDVAVLFRSNLTPDRRLELLNELSRIFEYHKIDLIDLNRATGLLKYEVSTTGRAVYEESEGFFLRYSLYCLRYYYDTKKFRLGREDSLNRALGGLTDG